MATYKINERLSEKYVDEETHRVVIAGDAAHCHGPAGGQGLNLGMQDAFDLAWKLALVLNCGADRRVMLATYEQERRLVAGRVLQHSSWFQTRIFSVSWFSRFLRRSVIPRLPSFVRDSLAMRNCMLATQYDDTALTDSAVTLPELSEFAQPGRRFPDACVVDMATSGTVGIHELFVSDAFFHLVVLLPAHLTAEQSARIAALESAVARVNGAKPVKSASAPFTPQHLRPVAQLASTLIVAPAEVAHAVARMASDENDLAGLAGLAGLGDLGLGADAGLGGFGGALMFGGDAGATADGEDVKYMDDDFSDLDEDLDDTDAPLATATAAIADTLAAPATESDDIEDAQPMDIDHQPVPITATESGDSSSTFDLMIPEEERPLRPIQLSDYCPSYAEDGIIRFTEIFGPKLLRKPRSTRVPRIKPVRYQKRTKRSDEAAFDEVEYKLPQQPAIGYLESIVRQYSGAAEAESARSSTVRQAKKWTTLAELHGEQPISSIVECKDDKNDNSNNNNNESYEDEDDDEDARQRLEMIRNDPYLSAAYANAGQYLDKVSETLIDTWEDRIIWDDGSDDDHSDAKDSTADAASKPPSNKKLVLSLVNNDPQPIPLRFDDADDWYNDIAWDERTPFRQFNLLELSPNDPYLLLADPVRVDLNRLQAAQLSSASASANTATNKRPAPGSKRATQQQQQQQQRQQQQRLSAVSTQPARVQLLATSKSLVGLSGDEFYEAVRKSNKEAVRQTFDRLAVRHSQPATETHSLLYKVKMNKNELRTHHRPGMRIPPNTIISFSRVKYKKPEMAKRQGAPVNPEDGVILTARDLTLKDTTEFVLVEYSEENPAILSNVGMGSMLVNYYRKRDPNDSDLPVVDMGCVFALEPTDVSPFMGFGNVHPGETIQTMYTNMYRAPLFSHSPRPTDFLVAWTTTSGIPGISAGGNNVRYYIRSIPHIFTAGQTYPLMEVPAPHSRKVNTTLRARMHVLAYRIMNRSPYKGLQIKKFAKLFPEHTEIQVRQRLKEFLEFHREGISAGLWGMKRYEPLPSEDKINKMLTPEMICTYQSMLVGAQHLHDAGYGRMLDPNSNPMPNEEEGGGHDEEDEDKLEVEQQLAPWIITKNFLAATAGKAMVKLHGAGDPTGIGEGFSFIRVSMKDIFLRAGETAEDKLAEIENRPKHQHRYNVAEQQQIYREEIDRVWKRQMESLSNPDDAELTDEESSMAAEMIAQQQQREQRERQLRERRLQHIQLQQPSRLSSMPPSEGGFASPPPFGDTSSIGLYDPLDDDELSMADSLSIAGGPGGGNGLVKVMHIKRLVGAANKSAATTTTTAAAAAASSTEKQPQPLHPMVTDAALLRLDPSDESNWETETIRDEAVIRSYSKLRRIIDQQVARDVATLPSVAVSSNSVLQTVLGPGSTQAAVSPAQRLALMRRRINEQLEALRQSQEKRIAKNRQKDASLVNASVIQPTRAKQTVVRRCGNCGQLGHMKTNKSCPLRSKLSDMTLI
ncbi:hypothetical protein GQ42DRAFT_181632 [Ramicandelaber brevisporus]|nr:hypothetical protein GQ42DRAFT_181632 [Ramicandelaber brevisporus]